MIEQELTIRGLLDQHRSYQIEPAGAGLNTRVYFARPSGEEPVLTIRVRVPGDHSTAEIDALSDVSGCPGVPRLQLLTYALLVVDYLPGEPRDLRDLNDQQFNVLVNSLVCIHASEYAAFSPWPETTLRPGTRADLMKFRIESLANYDCYVGAREGRVHGALPGLLREMAALDLILPIWETAEFSRLHGDLSRGNLLWHGDELGLIDWEYSRIGDPAEDLAYLLTEQVGGIDRLSQLAGAYIEAGGIADILGRIPAYGLFTAVDSALWWIDYGARHDRSVGDEVERRIESAQRWLAVVD